MIVHQKKYGSVISVKEHFQHDMVVAYMNAHVQKRIVRKDPVIAVVAWAIMLLIVMHLRIRMDMSLIKFEPIVLSNQTTP